MDLFLRVAMAAAVTGLAAIGVAGVVRGWTPPWGGRRVLRPKLWGYGSLLAAAGMALFAFLGPLQEPRPSLYALPVIGWCGFMGGLFLQNLSLRPGRRGGDATTKTSS
ncbi:hypothetical protein [Streptomyces sp. NPDC020996]|uniref:hypothetical protein n=1 Tax=Streptomyces sp. NPDC020996 TaxID=3154791 RepID=UPI003402C056